MSDQDKPNVDPKTGVDSGPAPAIDPAQFQTQIQEGVARALQAQRDAEAAEQARQQVSRPVASDNPLAPVLDPYLDPKLRSIGIRADAAYDASLFYATNPEAIRYKDEIEKGFQSMIQQGTPMSHETVWKWYKGENFEKFMKERIESDARKVDAAKDFTTVDGGARPGGATTRKEAFSATDDELKSGLRDVTF